MPVKSYRVSCMLMIQQCIFNQEDFPKINRSNENLTMQNHIEIVTNKLSKITGILK